jgi:S1-C subfamily serine protease
MPYDETPLPARPSRVRWFATLVAAAVLVCGSAALGRYAESEWRSRDSSATATSGAPFRTADSTVGGSQSFSSGDASSSIDVDGIANAVSPAIVNIQTTLEDGNRAAGTGMVITKSGRVLTNNHVIEGAEEIRVEIGVTGKTYTAEVVGYDVADDVALLQLQDASNMKTISVGDASDVSVNDPIVAIGNAQGRFGTPTVVSGVVSDVSETITAGDGGTDAETLRSMIEVRADIQSGDSGGPLIDASGDVIGINTAAEISGGRFGYGSGTAFGSSSGGVGYAIPIDRALEIADQIAAGDESNGVYVGSQRAMLGVGLESDAFGSAGAVIAEVQSGSAADDAGLEAGDTVVAVDGNGVGSADELRSALEPLHPGDGVQIDWVDGSGASQRTTIELGAGPPA